MKIVHITTGYNHGGAAIACKRLVEAQRNIGIDANIITQEPGTHPAYVYSTTKSIFKEKINFFYHAWEKFIFLFYEKSKLIRFQFSIGNKGQNFKNNKLIKDADIIHFHWFNAGFVSLKKFAQIVKTGKPIVWTLHDMWGLTGGCHYSGSCNNYQNKCGNCDYLKNPGLNDLSTKIYRKKQIIYSTGKLYFIAPSNWLAECARQSSLLKNLPIIVIPNTVPIIEIKESQKEIRQELGLPIDKKLILFGAFNINHKRKGASFLIDSLSKISESENLELLVFGKKSEAFSGMKFKTYFMGYSSDEKFIRKIYKAADVFVSPSTEETFGLTVAEALSVGTPAVSFNRTGVVDIIDHKKNGFLAEYKNSNQLVEGILWCLENNKDGDLSRNAIQKVDSKFSYSIVGKQFETFYKTILNAKS